MNRSTNDVSLEECARLIIATSERVIGEPDDYESHFADVLATLANETTAFDYIDDLEDRCGIDCSNARSMLVDIYAPDAGGKPDPNCPECRRAYGPHFTGHCPH